MTKPYHFLVAALLMTTLAPGCCCDSGADRLLHVRIEDDHSGLHTEVVFDGDENLLPLNAYFQPFFYGGPEDGNLTTVPMLELYDDGGQQLALERFTAGNTGGCALTEIFDPQDAELTMGNTYDLVHRASASPGDLDDSGSEEGDLRGYITTFEGERALVATIRVVEPTSYPNGAGGSDAGNGSGGDGGAGGGSL